MHKVGRYVLCSLQPSYYYFQRADSIVATYTPRNLDILKGLKERHRFIETFYKELVNESIRLFFRDKFDSLPFAVVKSKTGYWWYL